MRERGMFLFPCTNFINFCIPTHTHTDTYVGMYVRTYVCMYMLPNKRWFPFQINQILKLTAHCCPDLFLKGNYQWFITVLFHFITNYITAITFPLQITCQSVWVVSLLFPFSIPNKITAPPNTLSFSNGAHHKRKTLVAPEINISLDQSESSLLSDDFLDTPDDLDINVDDIETPDETDSLEFLGNGNELEWEGKRRESNLSPSYIFWEECGCGTWLSGATNARTSSLLFCMQIGRVPSLSYDANLDEWLHPPRIPLVSSDLMRAIKAPGSAIRIS